MAYQLRERPITTCKYAGLERLIPRGMPIVQCYGCGMNKMSMPCHLIAQFSTTHLRPRPRNKTCDFGRERSGQSLLGPGPLGQPSRLSQTALPAASFTQHKCTSSLLTQIELV